MLVFLEIVSFGFSSWNTVKMLGTVQSLLLNIARQEQSSRQCPLPLRSSTSQEGRGTASNPRGSQQHILSLPWAASSPTSANHSSAEDSRGWALQISGALLVYAALSSLALWLCHAAALVSLESDISAQLGETPGLCLGSPFLSRQGLEAWITKVLPHHCSTPWEDKPDPCNSVMARSGSLSLPLSRRELTHPLCPSLPPCHLAGHQGQGKKSLGH